MKKHEDEQFEILSDSETAKLVSVLADCDEMLALQAMGGFLAEVPPAPVYSESTRPRMYRKDHVSAWVKKHAGSFKPAVHKDAVGKLPDVKLSDNYPGISFGLSGDEPAKVRG